MGKLHFKRYFTFTCMLFPGFDGDGFEVKVGSYYGLKPIERNWIELLKKLVRLCVRLSPIKEANPTHTASDGKF